MEFKGWPSIPRLSKEKVTITEKIDGSNSAVRIRPAVSSDEHVTSPTAMLTDLDGQDWDIWAQSRKRMLYPTKDKDNFGFAQWVCANAAELVRVLGPGDHFGEWWGQGIQRGYGLTEKRFSLFNYPRWMDTLHPTEARSEISNLYVVPMLFMGDFYDMNVNELREGLRTQGSKAQPGFQAEGMVVYLREVNASYKVLLEGDDLHKWQQ